MRKEVFTDYIEIKVLGFTDFGDTNDSVKIKIHMGILLENFCC